MVKFEKAWRCQVFCPRINSRYVDLSSSKLIGDSNSCLMSPNLIYPRNHLKCRVVLEYFFLPCFLSNACDGCLGLCFWALSYNRGLKVYLNKFPKMSNKLSNTQAFSLRKRDRK